ncbi:extracellular solute-binding protein [Auritidibacter sp. NML130574]|nr:extracellular solute-binding protein [Auritidibacter sp. NML130574]
MNNRDINWTGRLVVLMNNAGKVFVGGLAITVTLSLAGCGPASNDAEQEAASAPALDAEECSTEEGSLRVYMNPWGPTLTDEFTADTGIETDIADLGGGEVLARISAEANNPQWDVVLLDGHGSLESLRQQGYFLENPPVGNLNNLEEEAQDLLPEDGAWIPISEHAAGVIAYNTEEFEESDAPETWEDLTKHEYAPVGIADPAVAAPAYPIVSWIFQELGTEEAEEYFSTINQNGLNLYDKNGPVATALATGGVKTAILQEQHAYEFMESGEPIEIVWSDEGSPGVVRAAAISANTPRPCAAAALIDWMLDSDNMTYLMEEGEDDGIITPYVKGVDQSSLPDARPEDPNIQSTDAEFAAENEAEIKDWFANMQLQ